MDRKTEMRRLRRARDLSLLAVQDSTGINQGLLSLAERGRYVPNAAQSAALEAFFGRPFAELMADAQAEVA